MNRYLNHTHPDAFVDFDKKTLPAYMNADDYVACQRCKQHGGWNLELNAYNLHGKEDTPANRHRFSHFVCVCDHCNGWGFVSKEETCQGHEWKFYSNLGRCYNRYQCIHCGKYSDVDSSD